MTVSAPKGLTPLRLRLLLSISLGLIILAGGGIFYLAYSQLNTTAAETGERVASANQSQDTLQALQLLEKDLKSKRDIINRTNQVTADSKNYAYQDRLVNDLTVYASRANLTITNINFSSTAGSVGAPAGGEAPVTEGGVPAAAGGPPGLQKATVDITLENPVNYRDLLNFLHYIEQNLTKLKVSRVVMTKSEDDLVTIDALNLEVYLR